MNELYCANCDDEASHIVRHREENVYDTSLCFVCKTAYEWGQASPDATIIDVDDHQGELTHE